MQNDDTSQTPGQASGQASGQTSGPKTKPCENCGAPLPLTGTFCLACDTPVTVQTGGLSVAETHAVRRGRPLMGIALVGSVVLVVAVLVVALVMVTRPHDDKDARAAVQGGLAALLRAEGGRGHACSKLPKFLSGDQVTYRAQCRALVGTDPGAHLTAVKFGAVHRSGLTGTVHLTGTIVDAQGSRPLVGDFPVSNDKEGWRYVWDGTKIG